MSTKSCQICEEKDHKYKCPNCYLKYCSLLCYKSHKSSGCEEKKETQVKEAKEASKTADRLIEHLNKGTVEDQDDDTVCEEKLEALRHDTFVKEGLLNPHLRQLIQHINDNETGAGMLIEAAMQDVAFSEFAKACISCVEPKMNPET